MKVAIVHYWLLRMRGGEKVVEALCRMYPDADLFTHVVDAGALSDTFRRHRIRTTFIAKLPRARHWYQRYLPLMPLALEQLDLRAYDLVISSESGPAKGVLVRPDALHVCYCHTPMRYAWDMAPDYLARVRWPLRSLARLALHYLRLWDQASAQRVDAFVANSATVAARIRRWYGRDATVVHPPVDVTPPSAGAVPGDFYLVVGQLVAYKRTDLAIAACRRLNRPLVIIGDGEDRGRLEQMAGPETRFVGWQPSAVVRDYLARCRALLFPGEEDFGIVPVEAMAAGRPVVAFGRGGATETVRDGESGVLFADQTVEGMMEAIERLETLAPALQPDAISALTRRFAEDRFAAEMRSVIEGARSAAAR